MPDEEQPKPETIRSDSVPEAATRKMTASAGGGLWEPPTIEEAAQLFPGYEVLALLGRGGMGAVYQARQIELDRLVAIKLLPLEISADADFADRFRREARAMAKLNHPNIITVYDFGTTSVGHLFFVMEFVEGANLHAIIRAQELSADQALWLAGQVCTALAYAHSKGVVHRDIKPANVMVDTEGNAKVADFGLARLTDAGAENLGHTQTGTVMGTPDYMAPEQMRGMNVDHRADIYSVGVMLYEMLCREVPRGIFSPPSVRTGCDGRVDSIVVKAMQSEPDRRYQSTQEMKTDVEAARVPVAAVPQPRVVQQPRAVAKERGFPIRGEDGGAQKTWIGIAVAVLVIGGLAFVLMRPAKPVARLSKVESVAARTPVSTLESRATPPPKPPPPPPTGKPIASTGAKPAPAVAAGAPKFSDSTEPWVDALADPGLLQLGGGTQRTTEGLLAGKDSSKFTQLKGPDYAVRLIVAPSAAGQAPKIQLRDQTGSNYMVLVGSGHVNVTRYVAKQALTNIAKFPVGRSLKPNEPYELEARIVGSKITVAFEGVIIGSVEDSTFRSGGVSIGSELDKPVLLHGVQYLDLSKNPAPAPPTASASLPTITGWQDIMAPAKDAILKLGVTGLKEEGGWLVASGYKKFSSTPVGNKTYRDVAMRGRVRGWVNFLLRTSVEPNGYYSAVFVRNAKGSFKRVTYRPELEQTILTQFQLNGEPEHDFLFTITGSDLRLWVDGQFVATARDATIASGKPGIGLAEEGAAIRDLAIAELPPDFASKLPPVAGSDEKWTDVLPTFLMPGKTSNIWKQAGTGLEIIDYKAFTVVPRQFTDVAVRATARCADAKGSWQIRLRASKGTLQGDADVYKAVLSSDGQGRIQMQKGKQGADLQTFTLPAGFAITDSHTMEFRAQGDRLSLAVDGQEVAAAQDATHARGEFHLLGTLGTVFEKVEYRELTSAASSPSTATKDAAFVNSLGMKFVPVPITGGSSDKQRVLLSTWETRVQDYEAFVKETRREWPKAEFEQGATHPAVNVSWDDATAFCAWLTKRERNAGKLDADVVYRLPTDHEWSCAAGLGEREDPSKTPTEKDAAIADVFPWGAAWPPPAQAGNYWSEEIRAPGAQVKMPGEVRDVLAGRNDGYAATAPAGSFPADRYGLHDLGGNAQEWCDDWMDAERKYRALRGAAWTSPAREQLLASNRSRGLQTIRIGDVGFRCVVSPTSRAAVSVAAKQTLDLLALADPAKDTLKAEGLVGANQWEKSAGSLAFKTDGKPGKICAPVALNGLRDYEVEVEVAQTADGSITLDFPTSAQRQGTLDFFIDKNISIASDETRQRKILAPWPAAVKLPCKFAGRVKFDADGENGTITASLNGQPVATWRGALTKLGKAAEMHADFSGQLVPALFIYRGDRTYAAWTLRVFEGEAKVLRGATK